MKSANDDCNAGWGNARLGMALAPLALALSAGFSSSAEARPFAYVSNYGNGTVAVIDTATDTVIDTINVGVQPFGVWPHPSGARVYVANNADDNISVIDTATNTVIATIPVGDAPLSIDVNLAGTRVYVTNGLADTVSVIDPATNTVIDTLALGTSAAGSVRINPANADELWITQELLDLMLVVDQATGATLATIPVGDNPLDHAMSPFGDLTYSPNAKERTVTVIETATNAVVTTIPVGRVPKAITVHPDGHTMYVSNQRDNNVSVIETDTFTTIDTVPVGGYPLGLTVHPDGSKVYVANQSDGTVSVIDTTTRTVSSTILIGPIPLSVGEYITPLVGARATGSNSRQVSCINKTTNLSKSFAVADGFTPWSCERSGLAVSPGDTIWMLIRGTADSSGDDLAGVVTGIDPSTGVCQNAVSGQIKQFPISTPLATAWNCTAKGLIAAPGELTYMLVIGQAT